MSKGAALPIRLEADVKASLTRIAEATGLSVSALVRMLIVSFVEEYERNGGQVTIPPQWQSRGKTDPCSSGNESGPALSRAAEPPSDDEYGTAQSDKDRSKPPSR